MVITVESLMHGHVDHEILHSALMTPQKYRVIECPEVLSKIQKAVK